jgi:hypothetical protein
LKRLIQDEKGTSRSDILTDGRDSDEDELYKVRVFSSIDMSKVIDD